MALADRVTALMVRPAEAEVVRADPVTLEEFGYLLGRGRGNSISTKAGTVVGPQRVLGITAWYSGVRYLSEAVAGLPWDHFMRLGADERERRAPQAWLASPDVEQTWYGFVEFAMMSLLHRGNSYSFKLRNGAGQVVGLRELRPDRVTAGQAPDGTKRFLVDQIERPFTAREVLHIPGLCYDGRVGLNPIAANAEALGAVAATDDYAARFFGSGTHLGGVISVPQELDDTQARDLRAVWDRFHQGLQNAHQTGVLSKGATYTPLALNAKDTQLIASRQWGVLEVARVLRIPPHKLYELSRATFSNIEHQAIEAVVDSVRPWVQRIEAAINADPDLVLPGHFVEANLEGLLRGDSAARASFYTSGINGGWLSPGKAARKENLPAPPELDYYLRPLNMEVVREGQNLDEAKSERTWQEVGLPALVAGGLMTPNEAREQLGLPPIAGGDKRIDIASLVEAGAAPTVGGSE